MKTGIVRVGNTVSVETPEELAAQAGLMPGEPVEWVANGAGSIALAACDSQEQRHIRAGLADLEASKKISHERVVEWLDSWGTENESPAPVR